jgi:hypothetical protein
MNKSILLPKVRTLKHQMVTAKKRRDETVSEYVHRMYSIKTQLVECDEVYADDLDVINWILCGLDHKVWNGINELVASTPGASTSIATLLPLLTNKEAAMDISRERFGGNTHENEKKRGYGVFHGNAHRGRGRGGSYSSRGNGRPSYNNGGREEKKCFVCGSVDHFIAACPYKERQTAPPSPKHRDGNSNRGRGGYSHRGGHNHRGGYQNHHMQSHRDGDHRREDRQPPPPSPKRVRYNEAPAPPSAMKHQHNQSRWRE